MNTLSILSCPLVGFALYLKSLAAHIFDRGERWYQEYAPCDKNGTHTEYSLYRKPRSTKVFADSNFKFTTVQHQQDVAVRMKNLGYTFEGVGPLEKLRWWHRL